MVCVCYVIMPAVILWIGGFKLLFWIGWLRMPEVFCIMFRGHLCDWGECEGSI